MGSFFNFCRDTGSAASSIANTAMLEAQDAQRIASETKEAFALLKAEISEKIDGVESDITDIEGRATTIENAMGSFGQQVSAILSRLESLEARVTALENK